MLRLCKTAGLVDGIETRGGGGGRATRNVQLSRLAHTELSPRVTLQTTTVPLPARLADCQALGHDVCGCHTLDASR